MISIKASHVSLFIEHGVTYIDCKRLPDRPSTESKTINNHSQMLHAGLIIGLLNSPLAETEKSSMHLCRVLYFKSIS